MNSLKYILFEKKFEFIFHYKNEIINNVITEQLSYYPIFTANEEPDTIINFHKDLSHHNVVKKNPSLHIEIKNGFIAEYPTYKVAFYFRNNKLNIDFVVKHSGNFLLAGIRKFINIEFATREERIAQTLFEGVLIPSLFFDKDKLLIHSSGFSKNNSAILVGGTGGSGKTSLEIELCLNRNYSFLNDDIAVIDNKGILMPNLAHPKIYGYNLVGNQKLKRMLFLNQSLFDKIHWWINNKIFGPSKVRRRLFLKNNLKYTNQRLPLKKYFILSKENIDHVAIEQIPSKQTSSLHLNIILAEYSVFLNHIFWHEFNSTLDNDNPIITYAALRKNILLNSEKVFNTTKNYIIRIPLKIDHTQFLKDTIKLIEEAE